MKNIFTFFSALFCGQTGTTHLRLGYGTITGRYHSASSAQPLLKTLTLTTLLLLGTSGAWGASPETISISDVATAKSWANQTKYTSFDYGIFSFAVTNGDSNTGKYYSSNKSWRIYSTESGAISISTSSAYKITAISSSPSETFTKSTDQLWTCTVSTTRQFTSFTITYTAAKAVDEIYIKSGNEQTKDEYTTGEYFDPSGLVLTVKYTDDSEEDIDYDTHSSDFSFTPALTTALEEGDYSVSVGYGGKSVDTYFTVSAPTAYTVNWYANDVSKGSQTAVAGTALTEPTTPNKDDCDGTKVFVGWTEDPDYSSVSDAPTDLFQYASTLTMPTGGANYYAVFATKTPGSGTSVTYEYSITAGDFSGSGYATNNGEHSSQAKDVTDASNTLEVKWESYQVSSNSGTQWQKTNGYIYNKTDLGKINSVTVSITDGSFTTYYGTSEHPTSATTLGTSDGFFTVQTGSTSAGHTSSLTINFTKSTGSLDTYSDYAVSCGPSVTITPSSLTAERPNTGTASVSASANKFTPTSWTWSTADASVATVSGVGNSATVTYKGSGTCDITCTASDGSTTVSGSCKVTVPTSFTINLVDNGTTTPVTNRVEGESYTLPSGASTCPDYTFLGWTTTDYTNGTPTKPTTILTGEQTLTSSVTNYYAVYSIEDPATKSYKPTDDVTKLVDGAHVLIYGNNPKLYLKTDGTVGVYTDAITTSTELTTIPENTLWTIKNSGISDYPHALYNGSQYLSVVSEESGQLVKLQDAIDGWNITGAYVSDNTLQIEKTSLLDLELYNGQALLYSYSAAGTHLWILLESVATTYTKQPSCGPTITAEAEPYITSANGLTIQALDSIDVKGTMLTGASTLIVSSDNAHFTAVLKDDEISDGKITTKLAVKYTPADANTTETATITIKDNLNLASASITVHGRSLPNSFVIVAKDGNNVWRSLPANMPADGTYEGIPTNVDSDSDPTQADRTAINTHYSLATANTGIASGATHSRYDSVPWTVRFIGDNNRCLYGAKSNNYIKNGVDVSIARLPYEWILYTADNETYLIKSNNNANDRGLCMDANNKIGLYASGNKEFRILPYDERCYYFAQPTSLGFSALKSSSVKILLDSIPYATQYQYKVNGASAWTTVQLSEIEYVNPASSKQIRVPVTGLTRGEQNTILIRGTSTSVADADLCAPNPGVEYQITTALCDNVVTLGTVTPSSTTATLTWTLDGFTCSSFIIRLYSDDAGTTQIGSDYHATGSPYVLTGLTESTQYYYRIYAAESGVADPGCPSLVGEFMTKSPSVEVMTWHPEQVDIAVNMAGTPVIMLQDEKTYGEEGAGKVADEIFFSKYFEASYNVKLLGIYNGTADTVDLSGYQLWVSTSGDAVCSWSVKDNFNALKVVSGPTNTLPMKLAPGKELIIYSYQTNYAGDLSILNCAESNPKSGFSNYYRVTYSNKNNIAFNGDDAVALYRIADGKLIDLIGSGSISGKNASGVIVSRTWNDNPGGWFSAHGTDTVGNADYELSTNRCLLIRKNIVYSGYNSTNQGANNAVDLNTANFVTLGDHDGIEGEWFGEQVPNVDAEGHDDHGVQASCDGFEWVGKYDYSSYYKAFETVVDSTRLDTVGVNDDGTYKIHVDTLYKMSCSRLKVQVYANPGDKKPAVENMYQVPIMVYDANHTTNDALFTKHGNKVCKECDVVIMDGKTLSSSTTGIDSVGHVMVYEGSQLDLTAKALNAASLTLRSRQDNVSSAYLPTNTSLKDVNGDGGQPAVYFEKYISDDDWHWITVPYPVNVAEISFTDNTPCVYRTDYWIKWYDGEARADNPKQADGRNWKHLDVSTTPQLVPGVGYIVGIKAQKEVKDGKRQWKALRFPMAGYDESSGKSVAVKAYGAGDSYADLTPNNKGWNLVGNPYLSYYEGYKQQSPLQTGQLAVRENETTGEEEYYYKNTSLYYVTIPQNAGRSEYSQELVSATQLPPFTSYFVQISGDTKNEAKSVLFSSDERRKSVVQRRGVTWDEEEETEEPVFIGVELLNAKGEKDNTGLCIHNAYSQHNYEIGGDLQKWMGTKFNKETKPVLFSIAEAGNMAFNALSESEAAQNNAVPLGCYTLVGGTYEFRLNPNYDWSRIGSVILYDSQNGTYTDLLNDTYPFMSTASETPIMERFYISATIFKKPTVVTDLDQQTFGKNKATKFITPDGHLHIAREGVIYDAQGRVEQIVK